MKNLKIDPIGDIVTECRNLSNGQITSMLIPEKLAMPGGNCYMEARKQGLYNYIIEIRHTPKQKVSRLPQLRQTKFAKQYSV